MTRSLLSSSMLLISVVVSQLALAQTGTCLVRENGSLPSATWLGKRYAVTWYARTEGNVFEQKFAFVEPGGEAKNPKDITPADKGSSVMGRLVTKGDSLGFAWMDDVSGHRVAHFRTIDARGVPGADLTVTNAWAPHGDQSAPTWNEKTKLWTVVFRGTQPTESPGRVTHHVYASSFRAEAKPNPATVRLDDDDSASITHSLAAESRGACVVTAWTVATSKSVVVATLCDGKTERLVVTDQSSIDPMYATLAVSPSGATLIAWTDQFGERRKTFFVLLDESGKKILRRGAFDSGGDVESPVAVSDATGWSIAWTDSKNRRDSVFTAHLSIEGNQQGPVRKIAGEWDSPTWVSFARGGPKPVVLISSSRSDCALSWLPLQ